MLRAISWGADEADWGDAALAAMETAAAAAVAGTTFVTPMLYQNQAAFNLAIPGENGSYTQPPNPGPCTGLGSPKGAAIAALFAAMVVSERFKAIEARLAVLEADSAKARAYISRVNL